MLKIAPFRQVLTAQKCCKKQYRIKIFLLHDENMTKSATHARRANQDKGLTKTAKNNQQKHIFKDCSQRKSVVKNNTESRFSSSVIKNRTHVPNANPHKNIEKTIEKRSHLTWGSLGTLFGSLGAVLGRLGPSSPQDSPKTKPRPLKTHPRQTQDGAENPFRGARGRSCIVFCKDF